LVLVVTLFFPPDPLLGQERLRFEQGVISIATSLYGAFLVDRDGFLWIGTTGLGVLRHDGHELKSFRDSIQGSMISSIVEDKNGVIWFASFNNGITQYDKDTGSFTTHVHDPINSDSLASNNISFSPQKLFVDRFNNLWVGSDDAGISVYNHKSGNWTHHKHRHDDPNSLSDNAVMAIVEDQSGNIWVGTQNGGLGRLNPETGVWTHYQHDPDSKNSLSSNWINSLHVGSDDTLWIGTKKGGLNTLDPKRTVFSHYRYDPDNPHGMGGNEIWNIHEDFAGRVWISHNASPSSGLDLFDKETKTFVRYSHNPRDPNSVGSNAVVGVYGDRRTETLWVLGLEGSIDRHNKGVTGFRHWPSNPLSSNTLSNKTVLPIIEDSDNVMWVGTYNGLNRIDRTTGIITHYLPDPNNKYSIPSSKIEALTEDSSGTIWVGFWGGTLASYDRDSDRFTHIYRHDTGNPNSITESERVKFILEDRDDPNILWITTTKGGLDRFDKKREVFTHYKYTAEDGQSISNNSMATLYDDGKGVLWIPTYGGGLDRFDKKSGRFINYRHEAGNVNSLGSNTLYEVIETSDGEMWISRKGGISRFDKNTGVFVNYDTDKDGVAFGAVGSLLEDDQGYLWLGTVGGGIVRFERKTGNTKRFTVDDGLQSNTFYWTSRARTRKGELWFGGSNGISSFYPHQIKENTHVPKIVLTAFTQGGEQVKTTSSPERMKEVVLDWRSNYFEFKYSALNFIAPEKNKYAYMLEGWDKEWYYSGPTPFGRYTGLAGGRYTLRLKGSNNDGIWNDEGVSITVIVTPPFWETWWFKTIIVLIVLVIFLLVLFYLHKLRNEVTERRRMAEAVKVSEERYRSLVEATTSIVWTTDASGGFVEKQPSWEQFTGQPWSEHQGFGWAKMIHPDDTERVRNAWATACQELSLYETWGRLWNAELNTWRDFEVCAVPIENTSGSLREWVGVISDITDRKQAEAEQTRLQRELQQAHKMEALGQVTGGIAHDFNNILGIIMGYSSLAKKQCVNKDGTTLANQLDRILKASERARDLVAKMLAFSRKDVGDKRPASLSDLIEEDYEMLRSAVPASVEIFTEFADDLPNVFIDQTQLNQILMNLCINAKDAMDGKGVITIRLDWVQRLETECSACHKPLAGDWVELSVSDVGGGLKPEILKHIFDPFFTTKEIGKGTGMGLAVIHSIMHNHEGHIIVGDVSGGGTVFRLLFPSAKGESGYQVKSDAIGTTPESGHGQQIMVIDDEPDLANYLSDLLESYGYRVVALTSSIEALKLYQADPSSYAMVITDQTMPGLTGLDLAQAMRKINSAVKIIIISGFSDEVNAHIASELDIVYMAKPINAENLIQKVGELTKTKDCH